MERSNELYFEARVPLNKIKKNIKIFLDKSGCEWVNEYKYSIHKRSNDIRNKLGSSINEEKFRIETKNYILISDKSKTSKYIAEEKQLFNRKIRN